MTNYFDRDNFDSLEPALKVNQGWTPAKLSAWATAQLAPLGAVAVLGEYTSQGGQKLSNIGLVLATDPDPNHAVASLYFSDDGAWWLSHNQTDTARRLVYLLYNQLIGQGIAVRFPDWIKANFTFDLPEVESIQPVIEAQEQPRPVGAVKFTPKQIEKARERTRKFKEFNDAHPTGYTPEAAAIAATGKSYRTIQRDLEVLQQCV